MNDDKAGRICRDCSLLCRIHTNRPPCREASRTGITESDVRPTIQEGDVSLARKMIRRSRFPLITGLGTCGCETQQEAFFWAAERKGFLVMDGVRNVLKSERFFGRFNCTLDEIRQKADLVILTGESMPGIRDRVIEQLSPLENCETVAQPEEAAVEVLHQLRMGVRESTLCSEMNRASFGVVFLLGRPAEEIQMRWAEVVEYLAGRKPFHLIHVRRPGNVEGAEQTCLRLGGFVSSFDFTERSAVPLRYHDPVEKVIRRGGVDLVIHIGSQPQDDGGAETLPQILLAQDPPKKPFQGVWLPLGDEPREGYFRCDGLVVRDPGNGGPGPGLSWWRRKMVEQWE